MRAVQLTAYGSADNLRIIEAPEPVAGPGQVRVKVEYAGVRWGDIMLRQGNLAHAVPNPPPLMAGLEVAGRIDQVGDGVTDLQVGDKVAAPVNGGGYAEYALVSAFAIAKLPESAPLDKALAYFVNLRVAYMIVYQWAKIREGETVLLHAAAGGIGLLVLQILKRRFENVRVIGICSSDEKAELLRSNGCDHVINRKTHDYVAEVTRICGSKAAAGALFDQSGGGVDVSINGVSGPTIDSDMKVIRKRGRWVIFGFQGGDRMPSLDTHAIGYDGITVMPFSITAWFGQPEWEASEVFFEDWLENEELNDVDVWPLDKVGEAESIIESGKSIGKTVIQIH